jgi:hypothetical protein
LGFGLGREAGFWVLVRHLKTLVRGRTWACNGKELRKLVVQETLEVCGDLYPDATERAVIFGAIEQFCGAPHGNGHFDNWKDLAGKKHKGTGVSDLEKARKDPASYGVTNRCVPGRMRPQRPARAANAGPSPRAHEREQGGRLHPPSRCGGQILRIKFDR